MFDCPYGYDGRIMEFSDHAVTKPLKNMKLKVHIERNTSIR